MSSVMQMPTGSVASNINTFTFNLYRHLGANPGNAIASPKNVLDCLAMVYAGSEGATADAMRRVCSFPERSEVAEVFGRLNRALAEQDGCTLRTANGLWAQLGFPFAAAYLSLLREGFGAEFRTVDFTKAANLEAITREINSWVEERTRGLDGKGKIKDLLSPDMLSVDTCLVLVSALYFQGNWMETFLESDTCVEPFHLEKGDSTDCHLMRQTAVFPYAETPEFQALELPYQGGQFALTVLLPRDPNGLSALESSLSADTLDSLVQERKPTAVQLFLPRWKVWSNYDLLDTLQAMGMEVAVTPGAELGGMLEGGGGGLQISAVIHQAFIDVNEKGTEAAAATAVVISLVCAPPPPENPKVFRADHPFVYVLRHVPTGAVLFVGRLARPE